MNVHVLLPGHAKRDAIIIRNAEARMEDDNEALVVTRKDAKGKDYEIGRFGAVQAYWMMDE